MNAPAVHANGLIIGTLGLLVRGDTGSGKSVLTDFLLETARARGHLGLLVADDYVHLKNANGRLLAQAPDTIVGKMEVRGFGLVGAAFAQVARIDLVIDLTPGERLERLPDLPLANACLEAVQVPLLLCPQNEPALSIRLIRWAFRQLSPVGPDYI